MSSEEINYPNLVHIFKKMQSFWNEHEEREEKIFKVLDKAGIRVKAEKVSLEHRELRKDWNNLSEALKSASEHKVRTALEFSGTNLIKKLRAHMKEEDWVLYSISWDSLSKSCLSELESLNIASSEEVLALKE